MLSRGPVHSNDYDVVKSSLADFTRAVEEGGMGKRVDYPNREEQFRFRLVVRMNIQQA